MSFTKPPRNPVGGENQPLRRDSQLERSPGPGARKSGKRYRLELSGLQLGLFGSGALLALIWMFVFGVMVGRDLPLADTEDQGLRGRLVRFLGLPQGLPQGEVTRAGNPVAKTDDANKYVEELNFQRALTQQPEMPVNISPPQAETPSQKKPVSLPSSPDSVARPGQKAIHKGIRPSDKKEVAPSASIGPGNEAHALLVASLRSQENAHKLVQRLRAKGYDPQLETLDKPDGGRWYRIVVGSFHSREDAQKFAAEFNKRENAQGMVIRLSP